jgi:hypothetical protein
VESFLTHRLSITLVAWPRHFLLSIHTVESTPWGSNNVITCMASTFV